MNSEVEQLWVEELASDNYKQGRYRLRTKWEDFCCLGVLCDIYHRETGKGMWLLNAEQTEYIFVADATDVSATQLPIQVMEWAGLSESYNVLNELVGMNDNDFASFRDIAQWIKRNV